MIGVASGWPDDRVLANGVMSDSKLVDAAATFIGFDDQAASPVALARRDRNGQVAPS